MASVNNWLAFSLTPHELSSSQTQVDDEVSADDCFGLSAVSPSGEPPLGIPTMRADVPYGILEAFNRTNHQHQDWNMKGLDLRGSSSDLSMIVGSSSNRIMNNYMEVEEPKLEDFLGGHSSSGDYLFSDYSDVGSVSHGGSSIGLSMIKTWLRNQPLPPPEEKSGGLSVAGNLGSQSGAPQGLNLSMSMASQSTSGLTLKPSGGAGGRESSSSPDKGGVCVADGRSRTVEAATRKSIDTFGQRTSIYRGVTRHRWTGRYEAHLWDNSCRREGQSRKGRQVYLGGYDKEDKAARAYDLAALKYWGATTTTNFPVNTYEKELEEMKNMTRQEYVASLRRKSSGFSRGASIYRGVTRHHQHGRWQARIGRVAGNKDLYLGTFSTQEEAAEAYDIAAIKFRGLNAVTNFDMSRYDVKSILESSTLPIGGAAKRLKDVSDNSADPNINPHHRTLAVDALASHYSDTFSAAAAGYGWPTIAFQQPQPLSIYYPYPHQRGWPCKQEHDAMVPAAAAAAAVSHSLHDIHNLSTHDFFQSSTIGMNSFLSPQDHGGPAASLEPSTGSNSVLYDCAGYPGYAPAAAAAAAGGYMLPMNGVHRSGCFGDEEGNKQMGIENYLGRSYNGYIGSQPLDQNGGGGGFTSWGSAAAVSAPAMSRAVGNSAGVCHGASLFSVWNDS